MRRRGVVRAGVRMLLSLMGYAGGLVMAVVRGGCVSVAALALCGTSGKPCLKVVLNKNLASRQFGDQLS